MSTEDRIAEALTSTLTGEQWEEITRSAIAELISPGSGSPITAALVPKVKALVVEIAAEMVMEKPETRERIRGLVSTALDNFLTRNTEMAQAVSNAIGQALTTEIHPRQRTTPR